MGCSIFFAVTIELIIRRDNSLVVWTSIGKPSFSKLCQIHDFKIVTLTNICCFGSHLNFVPVYYLDVKRILIEKQGMSISDFIGIRIEESQYGSAR